MKDKQDKRDRDRRYPIHQEISGDASEREDVWVLVFEDLTGRWAVEHVWRFRVPSSGSSVASGKGRLPIDLFEATPAGRRLQEQLRQALRRAEGDA